MYKINRDALLCTHISLAYFRDRLWDDYGQYGCGMWRLLVWKSGAHDQEPGYSRYNGIDFSTEAGKYYGRSPNHGGLDRDTFILCGQWMNLDVVEHEP